MPTTVGTPAHRASSAIGKRALVEGGEHDDLVVLLRAQPGEQLVEHLRVVRRGALAHPRHVGDEHLVDAGQQRGRGRPAG